MRLIRIRRRDQKTRRGSTATAQEHDSSTGSNLSNEAATSSADGLAPLITSHSMSATPARRRAWQSKLLRSLVQRVRRRRGEDHGWADVRRHDRVRFNDNLLHWQRARPASPMLNRTRLVGSGTLERLGVTVKRTSLAPAVYVAFANTTPTVCCGLSPVAVPVAETVTIVVLQFPGQVVVSKTSKTLLFIKPAEMLNVCATEKLNFRSFIV